MKILLLRTQKQSEENTSDRMKRASKEQVEVIRTDRKRSADYVWKRMPLGNQLLSHNTRSQGEKVLVSHSRSRDEGKKTSETNEVRSTQSEAW